MKRWTLAIVISSAALGGCAWDGDEAEDVAPQPQAVTASPQDLPQVPAPTAAPSQPVVTTRAPTAAVVASAPPVQLPPLPNVTEAPADFTFSVSVISPLGVRTRGLSTPQRPARYVMDADNSLRAWVGSQLPKREWTRVGGPDRALPGRTRQLSTAQVAKIWALMLQAGVVGLDNAQEPSSPAMYVPPKDTLAYVISYSADGDRGWAILDGTKTPTGQAEALITELSRLAFQEQPAVMTTFRAIVLLMLSLIAAALTGCASAEASPTDGYALTLRQAHVKTSQFLAYRLTAEGRLIYSAGRAAFVNEDASARPIWADRFSREELRPLVSMLIGTREIEATPIVEDGPELQLVVTQPGSLFTPVLKTGPQPQVLAILAELNRLQRGRRGDELVPPEVVPKY